VRIMRRFRRFDAGAPALVLALVTGCGDDLEPHAAPPTAAVCESSFAITDDTNYTMTSTLAVELTRLKDATDIVFDWSAVTVDYFGRPIDPLVDIDNVVISLWGMTPAELEENLRQDNLPLSSNKGAITTYPDDAYTSMNLLGFDVFGSPLPEEELWPRFDTMHPEYQYPQDTHTYMVTAGTGTAAGKGTRMLTLFNLDPASDQTELFLTNESTDLDFTVTLGGARPVAVPVATPSLVIDWREMTTNAIGNEYSPAQITRAVVAHFETESVSDLEAEFLNLEELAIGWWSGEVSAGASIELGTLLDETMAPFPGIDDSGTWMVALFCTSTCNHPAPWSITLLEPCDG